MKRPELLSPAGSFEHFKAAVENGADGIYFGGKRFNARQSALNFSYDEMKEAISYASLRDVKTYMTVNTLIKDSELSAALEQAEEGIRAGVTGFIVQDLGFASLLRRQFPDIRLHLSTQGTVYNREGAAFAEECGFKRVVLARELSEQAIREIVEHTTVETEIFVHGALCVCYSGQCLMSRMIGNRSGNRGSCAQPCRLPYRLEMQDKGRALQSQGYLLSPKDICLLEELERIVKLGVTSLKIEGRLKSPEYTALVTGTYRKYLDRIVDGTDCPEREYMQDMERLQQVFNRGGFTKGYFEKKYNGALLSGKTPKHQGLFLGTVKSVKASGKIKGKCSLEIVLDRALSIGDGIEIMNSSAQTRTQSAPGGVITYIKGKNGIVKNADAKETVWAGDITGKVSVGDAVYKTTDSRMMKQIEETYRGKKLKKSDVYGHFEAKHGKITFYIWDDRGNTAEATSETFAGSQRQMPSAERILEQLRKTGDTPFTLKECKVELEEGNAFTIAELNGLRRAAFDRFIQAKLGNRL